MAAPPVLVAAVAARIRGSALGRCVMDTFISVAGTTITVTVLVGLVGGGAVLGAAVTAVGFAVGRRHDVEHLVERAEAEREAGIRAGGELGWEAADRWYARCQTLIAALRHERDKARRWRRLAVRRAA